jgi:hypothetical protein
MPVRDARDTSAHRPGQHLLRSSDHRPRTTGVHVYASRHATAADVSLSVFTLPAIASDAVPGPLAHGLGIVDSRLVIRTGNALFYIYTPRPCGRTAPTMPCQPIRPAAQATQYCFAIVQTDGTGAGCTTTDALARGGAAAIRSGGLTFGVVPDFVTRVTYDGRDIPIVNNAFVIEAAGPTGPPILATSG